MIILAILNVIVLICAFLLYYFTKQQEKEMKKIKEMIDQSVENIKKSGKLND